MQLRKPQCTECELFLLMQRANVRYQRMNLILTERILENVAQVPEQRHFRLAAERLLNSIHFKLNHFPALTQAVVDARITPGHCR